MLCFSFSPYLNCFHSKSIFFLKACVGGVREKHAIFVALVIVVGLMLLVYVMSTFEGRGWLVILLLLVLLSF